MSDEQGGTRPTGAANGSVPPSRAGVVSSRDLQSFSRFAHRARSLVLESRTHADRQAAIAFRRFVDAATPLVLETVREWWAALQPLMSSFLSWHTHHDLFHETGCRHDEDLYTELLRWALAESTDPASALQRQTGWLQDLRIPHVNAVREAVEPQTQLRTRDGIPDLVLDYPHLTVIVEAKTNTAEHQAPLSKLPQTIAYVDATRQALGAPSSRPAVVIYLTLDGHEAANPDAIRTTYAATAFSLARALHETPLDPDVVHGFKTIITHFVTSASPGERDLRHLVRCMQPSATGAHLDDHALVELRDDIRLLHDSLGGFIR